MRNLRIRSIALLLIGLLPVAAMAGQGQRRVSWQRFHKQLPAGNYSGICRMDGGRFALVDDKAPEDGFCVVRIDIDSAGGRIRSIENEGYRGSHLPNRDMEGICYCPARGTLFISGEGDNEVFEYLPDGRRTGRRLEMPPEFRRAKANRGLEALAYDGVRHLFVTTTEQPLPGDTLLRLQTFGDDLQPRRQYLYRPDEALSRKYKVRGVSAMCALSDGRLIVVERQIRVPRLKIGARAVTRFYEVRLPDGEEGIANPLETSVLQKRLVREISTRLTLTGRRFANCEGICEAHPGLLLVVADSQGRYGGVLRDWFILLP